MYWNFFCNFFFSGNSKQKKKYFFSKLQFSQKKLRKNFAKKILCIGIFFVIFFFQAILSKKKFFFPNLNFRQKKLRKIFTKKYLFIGIEKKIVFVFKGNSKWVLYLQIDNRSTSDGHGGGHCGSRCTII